MMNSLRLFFSGISVFAALACTTTASGQIPNSSTVAFYRGDSGHSGYAPTTTAPILSVLWQHTLPDVHVGYSTPALVGGVLYLGAGKHVYALNAKSGTVIWQYPADGTASKADYNCPPAVADGKVFIGSDDNNLSVFDSATGAMLWQTPTEGTVESAPVVSNGVVFFGCSDGHLYAINESDQQPTWGGQFRTEGPVYSSPIVINNTVFFTDGNSNLYAVKASNGEKSWTYLPTGGINPGGPTYRNDDLYVVSGANILSLSSRTGAVRQYFNVPTNIDGPTTVSDSNIFVSGSDQQIYCLNLHGNTLWHTYVPDIVTTPMVITDSYLYATTRRGVLYALDPASGQVVWSYALEQGIVHPGETVRENNAQQGGAGVFGPQNFQRPGQGANAAPRGRETLPQATIRSSMLVQNGMLFVVADDGTVTAFSSTAADHVAPVFVSSYPPSNGTVAGADIQFHAFVTDIGSGINPSTVSFIVDGLPIPVFYNPIYSEVSVQYDKSRSNYGLSRLELPTLPDGVRTATLKISDWKGNVLTKTWSFTVDNSLDPPGSSAPITLHPSAGMPTGVEQQPNVAGTPTTSQGTTVTGVPTMATGGSKGGGNQGGGGNGAGGGGNVVGTGVTIGGAGGGPTIPPPTFPPGQGGGGGNGGNGGGGGGGGGGNGFPPPPPI